MTRTRPLVFIEETGYGLRVTMLVRFHIILIASGIAFCVGFGTLELVRHLRDPDGARLRMAIGAGVGALALSVYLYHVLRYGIRS